MSKLLSALITGVISVVCCVYFFDMWQRTTDVQDHCGDVLTYYN
jgi:ammonia channel protein AmtB